MGRIIFLKFSWDILDSSASPTTISQGKAGVAVGFRDIELSMRNLATISRFQRRIP